MNEAEPRLVLIRPTGTPPPDGGDEEVRLVLSGAPGEAGAPEVDAVVDAILAYERVVVW